MLTSRCLHISANQANPYQHSTESWDRLCKTHTYFTPNLYTFHTSPISNTLLKKTCPKLHPKYLPNPLKIGPQSLPGTLLGAFKKKNAFLWLRGSRGPPQITENHKKKKNESLKNTLKNIAWKKHGKCVIRRSPGTCWIVLGLQREHSFPMVT